MIPKQYLLSEEFDYSRTIAADVGPRYAANMGWPTAPLSSAPAHPDAVLVVDNRITERECLFVEQHIATRKNVVVLKIVDPFEEFCRNHSYYRLLFRVRQAPNVYFLSTYRPSEVVEDLDRLTERKKLVFVPYASVDTLNLTPDQRSRFPGVILPGALSKSIYPFGCGYSMTTAKSLIGNRLGEYRRCGACAKPRDIRITRGFSVVWASGSGVAGAGSRVAGRSRWPRRAGTVRPSLRPLSSA